MKNRSIKIAFWFSDAWVGMICLISIFYGLAMPVATHFYGQIQGLEHSLMGFSFVLSLALLSLVFIAYRVLQRSLWALLVLSLIVTIFSLSVLNWWLWCSIMPIILLPYFLVFTQYRKSTV